jgi:c-di-GMP-binding flagellar brake protein YcgR
MAWTPIKNGELPAGLPLVWNVYDNHGALVAAKGAMLDGETVSRLMKRGVVREVHSEAGKLPSLPENTAAEQAKEVRIPLADTSVRPGDTMHIDRSLDGARLTARMIGYLKGKSIIITIPADEQGSIYLKEGESIVAKVFSGKHVLAFPCTVLAVVTKPFPHIHLNYPSEVAGIVVRRSGRANVRIIAAIEAGREKTSGIITDLSTGGISLSTRSTSIEIGTRMTLNFKLILAGCPYILKLDCLVRAIHANESDVLDGATVYGLQFAGLSAEDILIIGLFVSQQQAEARSA